ncbi:MFS transporter [Aestuariimicrobium kwangyangense]|uniref:MFS transporter n=1 Tax=Aestuariimicrobium kwangyangense TaxID=396389 RepID=UPI0003B4E6EC|nr:MFS transporter [Aestuariimicrobium kwangyangense]
MSSSPEDRRSTARDGRGGHRPGDPGFTRLRIALFLAGVATFALLYAPQAVLPELTTAFAVTPGQAALVISAATLGLGVGLLVAGPLSDVVGRTRPMLVSLVVSGALGLAVGLVGDWNLLLVLRAVQGFTLAGLPAVATAYLREEVHPHHVSRATGLYIGGNALGGMSGRLVTGLVADLWGWRSGLVAIGVVGVACAVATVVLLPRSTRFVAAEASARAVLVRARKAASDPVLWGLYVVVGCLMGGFVSVYNVLGFRLVQSPFNLSVGVASLVFTSYVMGSVASSTAGRLADRIGPPTVVSVGVLLGCLGLAVTMPDRLWVIIVGLVLFTAGFFAAHGVASAWVTSRAARIGAPIGQAASFYLTSYYVGSSVAGAFSGSVWSAARWPGLVAMVGALWLVALAIAVVLGVVFVRRRAAG